MSEQDARFEVARLTGELTELRARLADAQADRDRWHASATAAIERYNHDMQEMRGLLGREQVIALSATSASVVTESAGDVDQASQEMPQDANAGTLRGDRGEVAPGGLMDRLRRLIGRGH